MITLAEALEILRKVPTEPRIIEVGLNNSLGMVLAEDVFSDLDMPPFNKSAMDGYACKETDLNSELKTIDYIPAGSLPNKIINKCECAKIMTGAKIPDGADTVIMVEHTREIAEDVIKFTAKATKSNICLQGEDVKKGDLVLAKGSLIKPASIGVVASVGKSKLRVFDPPKIALIATGDELVEVHKKPIGAEIRNSNSSNLIAQINKTSANTKYFGIVSDSKDALKEAVNEALKENDILIITGGVSMGDKDYVPEILSETGLSIEYEKLAIQPGKPTVFARGKGKYCFGLSGNPVSSLLQFELLVKAFIYHFMQHSYKLPFVQMKLKTEKKRKKTDRLQFFPIQLIDGEAHVLEFHGSAHIAGLTKADGFASFPIGKEELNIGEEVNVLIL